MKNTITITLTSLFVLLFVSCNNGYGTSDSDKITQLKDSIAKLHSRLGDSDIVDRGQSSKHDGEYEFTDANKKTWILTINPDNTATIRTKEMAYGSWRCLKDVDYSPWIIFSEDAPTICFEGGEQKGYSLQIFDGYIYHTPEAAQAKNPNKRLKIKKVK